MKQKKQGSPLIIPHLELHGELLPATILVVMLTMAVRESRRQMARRLNPTARTQKAPGQPMQTSKGHTTRRMMVQEPWQPSIPATWPAWLLGATRLWQVALDWSSEAAKHEETGHAYQLQEA